MADSTTGRVGLSLIPPGQRWRNGYISPPTVGSTTNASTSPASCPSPTPGPGSPTGAARTTRTRRTPQHPLATWFSGGQQQRVAIARPRPTSPPPSRESYRPTVGHPHSAQMGRGSNVLHTGPLGRSHLRRGCCLPRGSEALGCAYLHSGGDMATNPVRRAWRRRAHDGGYVQGCRRCAGPRTFGADPDAGRGRRLGRFCGHVRGFVNSSGPRQGRARSRPRHAARRAHLGRRARRGSPGLHRLRAPAHAPVLRAPDNPRLRSRLAMPEPGTTFGEATMWASARCHRAPEREL